jgi:DUF4097 and DUF4098 domain-containing protein YvlB
MSEQRFPTPNPVTLEVKVPSGDIRILTTADEESTVDISGLERAVDATTVELVGDRLVIRHHRKSLINIFERFDSALTIRVTVPDRSRVEVATASGEVALEGMLAGLEMKSGSGDLQATGEIDGDASVDLVSGTVRLCRVTGDLTARTVSGDIAAESVEGSVSARSVSGDVRVGSLRQGTTTVQSVSGEIGLGIAPGTSVDLDAASASGRLSSDIPLSDAPDGQPGPTVVIRGNTVSGDFRVFRAA